MSDIHCVQVVYHNWRHAFMVAQAMYSALAASGWWRNLGPVTCLGLLVACLCHDIDHRGQHHHHMQRYLKQHFYLASRRNLCALCHCCEYFSAASCRLLGHRC